MERKSTNISVEFSFYDLNMAKTLKEDLPFVLSTEQITNSRFEKEYFLGQAWNSIERYCRDLGQDYEYLLKSPPVVPIIIDSSHDLYFHFLEFALMFYDPFLIEHFLTYQYNNFKGNVHAQGKEEFLGRILFTSYNHIKFNGPNNNLHRKEKIYDWLKAHNVQNLPERFSMQQVEVNDNRYKGKLTQQEVLKYWIQLCSYKNGDKNVEVLNELGVRQFLGANFFGFNPIRAVTKLTIANITQKKFTKFCRAFFMQYTPLDPTTQFLTILKNNFNIYDNTTLKSMKNNFSR